jgi:hypothetical protein
MKESNLKKEIDTGIIPFTGRMIKKTFTIVNDQNSQVRSQVRIVDVLYNAIRVVQKDSRSLTLRMMQEHPTASVKNNKKKQAPPVGSEEPVTEINKFGYNPAMERRILYKQIPVFSKTNQDNKQWLNINYMFDHPDYRTAYRCDVEKYENTGKLNIRKNDDYKREEEFVAVDKSWKYIRQVMLQKKFETIYTESLNADEGDQKKIDKVADREKTR